MVTFFTMAYIVVLNPLILGFVRTATATSSAAARLEPARDRGRHRPCRWSDDHSDGGGRQLPLALATGLGLNAFDRLLHRDEMTWADAMGLVVLGGVIILVLVLTGFRKAVFHAVPAQLKIAISVGIGLFIALIGLVDSASSGAPGPARSPWSWASAARSPAGRRWSSPSGWSSSSPCGCARSGPRSSSPSLP